MYNNLNKSQLIDLAREQGLDVDEKMTNKEIIAVLTGMSEEVEMTTAVPEEVKLSTKKPEKVSTEILLNVYESEDEMYKQLKQEETVPVFVPLLDGEPQGSAQEVLINGVQFNVTKGKMVYCPKSIAEILNSAIVVEKNIEVEHLLK